MYFMHPLIYCLLFLPCKDFGDFLNEPAYVFYTTSHILLAISYSHIPELETQTYKVAGH